MTELEELWKRLRLAWPMRRSLLSLEKEIGERALQWLEQTKSRLQGTLAEGDAYASTRCPLSLCVKQIVERPFPGARCTAPRSCGVERLTDKDLLFLEINEDTLLPVVQGSLGLARGWERQGKLVKLGERCFGHRPVDFVFAPQPFRKATWSQLQVQVLRNVQRPLIVVTFHRQDIGWAPPIAGAPLQWLALSDALPHPTGLTFDLSEPWLAFAPQEAKGPDLWPRFLWVADPVQGLFWYRCQELELPAGEYPTQLLEALLRFPGQWRTVDALAMQVWSTEYGRRDADVTKLHRRVQQAKSDLAKRFEANGLSKKLIETRRAHDDTEGAYRIDVQPHQVHWRSGMAA